eukprot:SAG22_NODE_6170_length_890_cov_1.881163_1_plen_207_part_01
MAAMAELQLGYKVGIVGGGQLGRMLAQSAHCLGLQVGVVDPGGANCASACMSHLVIEGGLKDAAACKKLSEWCNVMTLEIEHVNTEALAELAASGVNVQPSPESVAIIQDKLLQKQHFAKHGVALPEFMDTPDAAAVQAAAEKFGLPMVLKSRKGGYDGRGNWVLTKVEDAQEALDGLAGDVYAEKFAKFTKELAVNVAKSTTGEVR